MQSCIWGSRQEIPCCRECWGRRQTKTVPNLEVAKKLEAKWKGQVVEEDYDLIKKEVPALTVVWEEYLSWAKINKKTWKADQYNYGNHIEPIFSGKKLDQIMPYEIENMLSAMKKTNSHRGKVYSDATRKHILVLLSRLYSFAEQWSMYEGKNPCKRITAPKLNNEITEHLTDDQLSILIDTLDSWPNRMSACIVKFLLYTGMRRGEVFRLKLKDIDLDKKTVTIHDPKGKKNAILPLSDGAMQVLNEVPREYDVDWIFYGKDGGQRTDFKGPWKRIRKAAKLPESFRLHGLRHHFASQLVSSGVDLYTVGTLLTHKSSAMTRRYAHLSDKALRAAVEKSDSLVAGAKRNKE